MPDNCVDAVVTDPPYCLSTMKRWGDTDLEHEAYKRAELEKGGTVFTRAIKGFMGKDWDNDIAFQIGLWAEVLRVAKPGAHLLAFGGTRTWHRLAVALEDAGWEVRDTVMWLYGSGFPKSYNIYKAVEKAIIEQIEAQGVKFEGWLDE